MAFDSYEFTFNGMSCRQFDCIMYDLKSERQDIPYPSAGTPRLDTVFRRSRSTLRGVENPDTLEFTFEFGLCPRRIEKRKFFDRFEMEEIATWLTGGKEWGWLTIDQFDLHHVRYRCMITELTPISTGWETYGFTCKVVCDSPYAYMFPQDYKYHSNGLLEISFFNRSSMNQPYCPTVTIDNIKSGDIAITCKEDGGRGPTFKDLPNTSTLSITLDGTKEMLTSSTGQNLYPYFNFQFLRLCRGGNNLTVTGKCDLTITCEFPVNVGA